MKIQVIAALAAISVCVSGCAAVFDGTTQEITVSTNPSNASCTLERKGGSIATIAATPGSARIRKTKDDITIRCNKAGYEETTYLNHSGVAGAAFGNIVGGVLTGGIAWGIDSASGADNKYDSVVNLTLAPARTASAASAPPTN